MLPRPPSRMGRGIPPLPLDAYGASTLAPSALVSAPAAPRPLGASLLTPSAFGCLTEATLLLPPGAATASSSSTWSTVHKLQRVEDSSGCYSVASV